MAEQSRPVKKRRKDKNEVIRELDEQLLALENKVKTVRRQLVSAEQPPRLWDFAERVGNEVMDSTREFVKSMCMLGFQQRSQPLLWNMFVQSYKDSLDRTFVRAALESGSAPQNVMESVPSGIFEENYEYWMKAVPDCPILLTYLPTAGRYNDFDDDAVWWCPSLHKSRYYWLRQFRSAGGEKADVQLDEFEKIVKQTPSLQTDVEVLAAATKFSCQRNHRDNAFDILADVDPSVVELADWEEILKDTGGFALKRMAFDMQVLHAATIERTVQFYDSSDCDSLRPLIAPDLWAIQKFCVEWVQQMEGNKLSELLSLIPSGAWSDRSFCLAFAASKNECLVSPNTLRPLVAPALWSDRSFCLEWVQRTKDSADKLRVLIPDDVWSDESFCVVRAKHMAGEVQPLFERFPAYRTSREFWLSLLSGETLYPSSDDIFRAAIRQAPSLGEDVELMVEALRWGDSRGRPSFYGDASPHLLEQPDFLREALKATYLDILEVVPHDLQRRFAEIILECFSQHNPDSLSRHAWTFLATDFFRLNRSFWLKLAPSVSESSAFANRFRNTCPFLKNDRNFAVQVCLLAHKPRDNDEERTNDGGGGGVEQLYTNCKLEIRDRLRAHECHLICLELEPTMDVPGLKEEFTGYLGISEKELPQLKAIWKKYH